MSNKKPNFFIVGAPRSGTTALYEYLKKHPDIYMAPYKEPLHFATDLAPPNPWIKKYRKRSEYLKLFSKVKNEKAIGEGSVHYLFSKTAAVNIKKFNPDARIIMILRNPVDAVQSMYFSAFYAGLEDIKPFEKVLETETLRKKGKLLPKNPIITSQTCLYQEIATYPPQVNRFHYSFPKKNIMILLFDDFKKDTPGTYKKVLKFLQVNPNFHPKFNVVNSTNPPKSQLLQSLIILAIKTAGVLNLQKTELLHQFHNKLNIVNKGNPKRPNINPKTRKMLQQKFTPDILKLEKVIHKDLHHWLK